MTTVVERVPGLVSVIIPVFNRTDQLGGAVHSVLVQDHRPVEILIVDDGSTDPDTAAALAMLANEHAHCLRVLRRDNGGPGLARETGRIAARGEFLQYLDSDDVLLPGKFSVQVAALRADPSANVAYGITRFRRADGTLATGPHKGTGERRAHMFPDFLNDRWWDTSTPLYRRSLCDSVGPWSMLRLQEDWEYDCRVASMGGRLAYSDVEVSETRDHGEHRLSRQTSPEQFRAALAMGACAHELVWQHALRAELEAHYPDAVSRYARSMFLLARQCGAAGLERESARLLDLATEAAVASGAGSKQVAVYRWVSRLVGLRGAGVLAAGIDRLRAAIPRHVAR